MQINTTIWSIGWNEKKNELLKEMEAFNLPIKKTLHSSPEYGHIYDFADTDTLIHALHPLAIDIRIDQYGVFANGERGEKIEEALSRLLLKVTK